MAPFAKNCLGARLYMLILPKKALLVISYGSICTLIQYKSLIRIYCDAVIGISFKATDTTCSASSALVSTGFLTSFVKSV